MSVSRPWVAPTDVLSYSSDIAVIGSFKSGENGEIVTIVPARTREKIAIDITRAEAIIIKYCHHDFSNEEKYTSLPENVRVATILLAEALAHNDYVTHTAYSNYKSESMDDYSYTAGDATAVSIDGLNLSTLLDEYVENKPKRNVFFRLRRL